jgi:hypothetical protein
MSSVAVPEPPPVLPFRLRIPGKDQFQGIRAVSTSFKFHGLLRLEDATLVIEWTGSARVQSLGALGAREDDIRLPTEILTVPLGRLRRAEVAGGWWRPRLELSGRDLAALAAVPSEDQGRVRFLIRHRDRPAAALFASLLTQAIAAAPRRPGDSAPLRPVSEDTPSSGPDAVSPDPLG